MTDDEQKASAVSPDEPPADGTGETETRKPYKSPTISRHGNLRLMTQLE
jgi:hypothetical protein